MKTLFFIAALAGAVYLILQTPAGQSWLEDNESDTSIQQEVKKVEQVSSQVAQSLENKMTEFTQRLNQKQQAKITLLENRIAELESELVMSRTAKKEHQTNQKVVKHIDTQPEKKFVTLPTPQGFTIGEKKPDTLVTASDKQFQRNRQAKLQDIAQKMEMSSLQALVN